MGKQSWKEELILVTQKVVADLFSMKKLKKITGN